MAETTLDDVMAAIQGLTEKVESHKTAINKNADSIDAALARIAALETQPAYGSESLAGILTRLSTQDMRIGELEGRPIGQPNGDELEAQRLRALAREKEKHQADKALFHPDLAKCAQEGLPVFRVARTFAELADATEKGYVVGDLAAAKAMIKAAGEQETPATLQKRVKELHQAVAKQNAA